MGWLTLAGLKEEVRKIEWPKRKTVAKNTRIVIGFIAFFVVYFVITEFILVGALRLLGIGG